MPGEFNDKVAFITGAAHGQGRAVALQAGFSMSEATLIATAISELARNIVSYADQGSVTLKPVHGPDRKSVV